MGSRQRGIISATCVLNLGKDWKVGPWRSDVEGVQLTQACQNIDSQAPTRPFHTSASPGFSSEHDVQLGGGQQKDWPGGGHLMGTVTERPADTAHGLGNHRPHGKSGDLPVGPKVKALPHSPGSRKQGNHLQNTETFSWKECTERALF